MSPNDLSDLRLRLHPSVRIVPLAWSIYEAWSANRSQDGAERRTREVRPCDGAALLWRFGHEVEHRALSEAEAAFFNSLRQGESLGEAAARSLSKSRALNISLVFAGALEARLFDAREPDMEDKREE